GDEVDDRLKKRPDGRGNTLERRRNRFGEEQVDLRGGLADGRPEPDKTVNHGAHDGETGTERRRRDTNRTGQHGAESAGDKAEHLPQVFPGRTTQLRLVGGTGHGRDDATQLMADGLDRLADEL